MWKSQDETAGRLVREYTRRHSVLCLWKAGLHLRGLHLLGQELGSNSSRVNINYLEFFCPGDLFFSPFIYEVIYISVDSSIFYT